MATCTTCKQDYDESDAVSLKRHTEPVHCSQTHRCRRCYGAPSCYLCQSSFCYCTSH